MFDKTEDKIDTKVYNRMKYLRSEELDYENYKSSIMLDECNENKKRREEFFLSRRKFNILYSPSNTNSHNNDINNSTVLDKSRPVENNSLNNIPEITHQDLDQIKILLSESGSNSENYQQV